MKLTSHRMTDNRGAWLLCLLASTVMASGLWAQGESHQARGKRVVNEALAALGGDAFLHMQDRVETGRALLVL